MAVTVKKAVLWRKDLDNRPGTLAATLKPLAEAGVNLQVCMGYSIPGEHEHAAVEVYPVSGAKAEQAAGAAGLEPTPRIACLMVTGDDHPGLGHAIADRLASNGINISFVMVQVIGKQYNGVFGFESQEDADKATTVIKEASKAVAPKRKPAAKKAKKGAAKKGAAKKGAAKKGTARGGAKKKAGKKAAAKKPAARKAKPKKKR
jgi:hypothetical protein